jgi:glycosyltransferase involved in cell wall biosynthesis
MKILLLSRYTWAGASSRYRTHLYLPYLRQQGHEITVAPLLSDFYIRRLYAQQPKPIFDVAWSFIRRAISLLGSSKYDLIWLEGEAFPWMPYWIDSMLFKSKIPYIVDYDDALFHRYDQHPSELTRKILGKKIDLVMKNASLVIVGNKYLAQRTFNAGAKRVEIIPTVVDIDLYPCTEQPRGQTFTIGWIGSLSTARYLLDIESVLQHFCREGKARLVIIGIRELALKGVDYEIIQPWSEELEIEQMKSFDVGIMPLTDSLWERGKCGHKLIKYMAMCRPVVASPVGVNSEIVDHGINGLLASSREQWIEALTALQQDAELRQNMGHSGRKKVEHQYDLQINAPKLEELLREAASNKLSRG